MSSFKPIKQKKASEEVFEQLRLAIFDGKFVVGDKLPSERELIESFQVSRTVVREAVKGLEASGLVQIKQGATGGAFVKEMNFEVVSSACHDLFFLGRMSFDEICETRFVIEPQVARLAARHCTPEIAEQLLAAEAEEAEVLQYPETVHARQKVHVILADACENRLLGAMAKSMLDLVSNITFKFEPDTNEIHPPGLHKRIVEAVIARDEDAAEAAMKEHLGTFLELLQNVENDYRKSNS
ncbi:FadR/GntR family transcriptional regulator [Ferrimonas futtsuensis]|uniref:FadR/GntR family transcriptional regulator n=1 Tax=Ferrimonas futtsuensis TaxID=364764 RepID=UPI00040822F9|nr:FCD domain-containing protein [Ferrimonas futtsuensis]